MIKIGGGFWPFWAGKRAVFDSEVLATLPIIIYLPPPFRHFLSLIFPISKSKFPAIHKSKMASRRGPETSKSLIS